MKIHLVSDLHNEHAPYRVSDAGRSADVIVLAGDIAVGEMAILYANMVQAEFEKPVIFVPGNHEYYRRNKIGPLNARFHEMAEPGVHVLTNGAVEIDGVIFMGGTLWTDFALYGNPEVGAYFAEQGMNDYRVIEREPYGRLRAADTKRLHVQTREYLSGSLYLHRSQKRVVVTHHLPSEQSVPARFRETKDSLNPAFASNLEALILEQQPDLWLHGHTHSACDYMIGKTRVVCNPRGYPGESGTGFDPRCIIDI